VILGNSKEKAKIEWMKDFAHTIIQVYGLAELYWLRNESNRWMDLSLPAVRQGFRGFQRPQIRFHMPNAKQLEDSIRALEGQRAVLRDAVVDPAIAALRENWQR
jgi:hypothetical protein